MLNITIKGFYQGENSILSKPQKSLKFNSGKSFKKSTFLIKQFIASKDNGSFNEDWASTMYIRKLKKNLCSEQISQWH